MTLIYQITDTHVPQDPNDVVTRNFLAQLDYINDHPADLLVISGDLPGKDGDADIYRFMKDHIGADQETVVIPGNHDNPEALLEVFGEKLCKNANFLHTISLEEIDLVFTNSGSGSFPSDQLAYLQAEHIREHSILFTHYPTKKLSDGFMDSTYPLANISETDEAIRNSRINTVFCGHFHCEHHVHQGYDLFVTPSAAFAIELTSPKIQISAARIPIRRISVDKTNITTEVLYL